VRKFNVQVAAALFTIFIVLGSGSYVAHKYQLRRNAYAFMRQADRWEEQAERAVKRGNLKQARQDYVSASKCLKAYVYLMPYDVDALEKCAMLMADIAQDYRARVEALGMLERVLREDPERVRARRKLVDVAILVSRFQDARMQLKDSLIRDYPKDAELQDLLGRCYQGTAEFQSARDCYKKAIEVSPRQMTAYSRLARVLYLHLSGAREAAEWMDKLVQRNPKAAAAHFDRALYLFDKNEHAEALNESLKSLELKPDNSDALLLSARCYLALREVQKCREYAARGMKLYPNDCNVYLNMVNLETATEHVDKAIAVVRQGLSVLHQEPALLWTLANLLIDANQLKEAESTLEEMHKINYPRWGIEYLAARMEMVQGHWRAAREGFEKVRGYLAAPGLQPYLKQVDLWLADCYSQLGNRDQQIDALRRAVRTDPFSAIARANLAQALLSAGSVDEATKEYRDLMAMSRMGARGLPALARLLVYKNYRLPPAERDWATVEKALGTAEKSLPDSAEIVILRAEVLAGQNRLADADAVLQKARNKAPKDLELCRTQIALAERQQDWKKAEQLLGEFKKLAGDTVDVRLTEAGLLVLRNEAKAVDRLEKLAENTDRFSKIERTRLWHGLAADAAQAGDPQHAKLLYQRIAEKDPYSVPVRYRLMEQALRAKNLADIDHALQEVQRVAGQDAYWHYGQAYRDLLVASEMSKSKQVIDNAYNDALKHLSEAREAIPSWSAIPALLGRVHEVQSKTDWALKNYMDAVELGERDPQIIRQTLRLLFNKQRYYDADRLLRELQRQQLPLSPDMTRVSAELAIHQGDFQRALAIARKAAAGTKDYQDDLWLGQILSVIGRQAKTAGQAKSAQDLLSEAERALRRAVELEPKIPATWIALVQFFSASEARDQAEKVIAEVSQKIPVKQVPLALAQCYEAVQDFGAAQKKYEAALAADPQDAVVVRAVADFYCRTKKSDLAEVQLSRMLEGKLKVPEADVLWARRELALIVATRGGYQNFQRARELIDKNLATAEASMLDRRARAVIDLSDPVRSRRKEGIRMLETMVQDQIAAAEDRYELAQMYLAAGNWIQASVQFRALVTSYGGDDQRYLTAYVLALLDHGEIINAELYLDRLAAIASDQVSTVILRARMAIAKNDPNTAFDLLKGFVDKPGAKPADRNERLYLAAAHLEKIAQQLSKPAEKPVRERFVRQAETFYRASVEKSDAHQPELVSFLARQGRIDEAMELLDRTAGKYTPVVLARVTAAMARSTIGKQQGERLGRILQAAMKRSGQPVTLLLAMADLCARQSRNTDAENLYREVLRKNSDNTNAMTELAILLAQQGIKLEEALKLANQAVEIVGPVGMALDARARVYLARGDTEKALTDADAALADSESPLWFFRKAQVCDRAGRPDDAAAAMQRALRPPEGLTKEMLPPLELASFEKLSRLARPAGGSSGRLREGAVEAPAGFGKNP
jgi:tetratricopeptide (TPR) repeat protein